MKKSILKSTFKSTLKSTLKSVSIIATALTLGFSSQAFATVHCEKTISSIFSGDEGHIWLNYTEGGSGILYPDDKDTKNSLALGSLALMSGNKVQVRYEAATECDAAGNRIIGLFLHAN